MSEQLSNSIEKTYVLRIEIESSIKAFLEDEAKWIFSIIDNKACRSLSAEIREMEQNG